MPSFARLLLVLCAMAPATLSAQISDSFTTAAVELRQNALNANVALEVVSELSQEIGPRHAGSAGDKLAVVWAEAKLKSLGFKNVRTETVKVPHWERGDLRVSLPDHVGQELVATSLGGSIGTPHSGIEAPLVRVESLTELRALTEAQARGKIVYIDQRMEPSKTGSGYSRAVGSRVQGASIAASKGALALVIRSVGTSSSRIAHTGTMIYTPGQPRIPAVALAHPDADRLTYLLAKQPETRLFLHSTARQLGTTESANVIGEIPGQGAAEEIVLLAAHLDSWDLGTGALDDGAGVAIVVAAAQAAAKVRPRTRRTIRVVLYANEEYGLSGARAYRANHSDALDRHIVAMESDFGAGPVWRFSTRIAEDALPLADAIHEVLAPLGIERGTNSAAGGADIRPLRDSGVPVFGLDQNGYEYFNYHHTVDDTLDKIKPAELSQNVAAMAVAAYLAAVSATDFGRLTDAVKN